MRSHSLSIAALLRACPFLPLAGCSGIQSALAPSGEEADTVLTLLWTVTVLSAAITLLVIAITVIAIRGSGRMRNWIGQDRTVIGGGIVFPVVVLSLLLFYGLAVLQAGAARTSEAEGPGVTITGERWWWRVVYTAADGKEVVSANELRLPVGQPVALRLKSDNVIHSFWAPQLAGKLDMIPGRTNVLTVKATEAGVSRGQCAEYCGGAHALMSFYVVALPEAEYRVWLANEAAPAREPVTEEQRHGQRLFLDNGCGACHTVRGTRANGTIGPDLTHVGSRMSLAAATLPNDAEAFARWIADNQHIKPDNLMPPFRQFEESELQAVAAYLESLK
jgi:cytochrome c oxidase subunit 2